MLALFDLALALSPERLPALNAVDDFDFTLSLLLDAVLLTVDGFLEAPVLAAAAAGFCPDVEEGLLAVMMVLGLFCPVLLVAADDGLSALLTRCDGREGSEGNLVIIGGLGGRADVNFWVSILLVDREDGEAALVFFLNKLGEDFGDSFFSNTGESWSWLLLAGTLRRLLITLIPDFNFFEAGLLGSVTFRVAIGLFGEEIFNFLVAAGDLFFPAVGGATVGGATVGGAESLCLGVVLRGE